MFNYKSQKQLDIFDFKTDFESKLDPNNRWVKLANLLDWDKFAAVYAKSLSPTTGASSIDARIIIGALIIKHIEAKDDRGTIEVIQENPYMQFFLGFDSFNFKPIFDPSLFVHIRKRLGDDAFDEMNQLVILQALAQEQGVSDTGSEEKSNDESDTQVDTENKDEDKSSNRGKLQLDATVCDAHIKYPTDLGLLNDGRLKSEKIIDTLCEGLGIQKPRTYRQVAKKDWLNLSKSKKIAKKKMRAGIRKQLSYLKRNLNSIDKIIETYPLALSHLSKEEYRYLLIISELYRQQQEMYDENKHRVDYRIVSIHQPHVRPIVRGKQGKNVEFGAKINVSLQNGYATIDQFSFEAFNEGGYLIDQVEKYKKLHGHYPELVQTDGIYMTQQNRKFLKDNQIRHTGKPLGRPPQEQLSKKDKKIQKVERAERNHIEGKFGQGKTKYGLNKIMARLANTSKSWIGAIVFVLNILKLSKDIFVPLVNSVQNLLNHPIKLLNSIPKLTLNYQLRAA